MIRIASSQAADSLLLAASAEKKSQDNTLEKQFSKIIAERIANPPFANPGEAADQPAVTISKVMPDGSILITTVQGTKIISQKRTRGNNIAVQNSANPLLVQPSITNSKIHKTKFIPTLTDNVLS